MIRRPPRSTRTDTRFPYTTLFRSAIAPNPLDRDDPRHPRFDRRYAKISAAKLPDTECLKDTVERVLPFWNESIAPAMRAGRRVLIAAHGNRLRAIIKHLDGISDDDIVHLNITTGQPVRKSTRLNSIY